MAVLGNVVFALLALGSFGYLAFNLKRIWSLVHVGVGKDDDRFDQLPVRFLGMLRGGFLQEKMLKDFWPAIMHYLIFFGFVTVTIGTVETLLHGVFDAFSFKLILGQGAIYHAYLYSQDFANFAVASAIIWAFVRRLAFKPWRLSQLDKHSRVDAYIVLGLIGLLVGLFIALHCA